MQSVTVSISQDGTVRFLDSEDTRAFVSSEYLTKRASHVEPVDPILRNLFHALRARFGEKGLIAGFTRMWPCLWQVNLSPISGPILPGTWRDRKEAIRVEVTHLNEFFI